MAFASATAAFALLLGMASVLQLAQQNYRPGTVIVAYRDDVGVPADRFEVAPERVRALQALAAQNKLDDEYRDTNGTRRDVMAHNGHENDPNPVSQAPHTQTATKGRTDPDSHRPIPINNP
jgi:hypothetical protein